MNEDEYVPEEDRDPGYYHNGAHYHAGIYCELCYPEVSREG